MNGPEHYTEAERILNDATHADAEANPADVALLLQFAQVHSTLALAAATAASGRSNSGRGGNADPGHAGMHPLDFKAWDDAAGVRPDA